jgi:hypothetical protein
MVALALAASTASVYADDELDTLAASVERAAATPQAERAAVDRMAQALTKTADTLRAERASSRLGWGDLYIAHRIAARGGHAVDKVVGARRSGATWKQIAEEAGVEPVLFAQDVLSTWPELKPRPAPTPPPAASEPLHDKPAERAPVKPPDTADEVPTRFCAGRHARSVIARGCATMNRSSVSQSDDRSVHCSIPWRTCSSGSGTRATSPIAASRPSCSSLRAWDVQCSSKGRRA